MKPSPKIIKSTKFEDGTFTIKAPTHPTAQLFALPNLGEEAPLERDPMLMAAEESAAITIARGKEEADAMLAAARVQIADEMRDAEAEIMAQQAKVLAEAKQMGFAEGLALGQEAGQQAVLDQFSDQLNELQSAVEQASEERLGWFEAQEKELIKLSLLIAQKILVVELATSRESVLKMAEAALKHVTDKTQVRMRVHPQDLPLMLSAKANLMLSVDNLSSLELVGDPTVGLGGCMIDTRTGCVDARLATQLAEVAASLLDLSPGPDGTSDLDPMLVAAIRALGEGGHGLMSAAAPGAQGWQMPQAAPAAAPPAAAALMPPAALDAGVRELRVPAAPPDALFTAAPVEAPVYAPEQSAAPAPVAPVYEPDPTPAPVAQLASAPEPAPAAEPLATSEPSAPLAATPRNVDPSRRAAEGLALRLGHLKRGKAIHTMAEEHDLSALDGAMSDAALDELMRQVAPPVPLMVLDPEQPLVPGPGTAEEAADALAARLGQKRRRPTVRDRDDSPSASQLDELDAALGDATIDQIMKSLIVSVPAAEAPSVELPSLDKASDNLARLLGTKKKKTNRAWYDQG